MQIDGKYSSGCEGMIAPTQKKLGFKDSREWEKDLGDCKTALLDFCRDILLAPPVEKGHENVIKRHVGACLWPRIVDSQPHGNCSADNRKNTLTSLALLGGIVPLQRDEIQLGPYQLVDRLVFCSDDCFAKSIPTETLRVVTLYVKEAGKASQLSRNQGF